LLVLESWIYHSLPNSAFHPLTLPEPRRSACYLPSSPNIRIIEDHDMVGLREIDQPPGGKSVSFCCRHGSEERCGVLPKDLPALAEQLPGRTQKSQGCHVVNISSRCSHRPTWDCPCFWSGAVKGGWLDCSFCCPFVTTAMCRPANHHPPHAPESSGLYPASISLRLLPVAHRRAPFKPS